MIESAKIGKSFLGPDERKPISSSGLRRFGIEKDLAARPKKVIFHIKPNHSFLTREEARSILVYDTSKSDNLGFSSLSVDTQLNLDLAARPKKVIFHIEPNHLFLTREEARIGSVYDTSGFDNLDFNLHKLRCRLDSSELQSVQFRTEKD